MAFRTLGDGLRSIAGDAGMKRFNVTGLCTPEQDYMADISEKIRKIQAMVDAGEYFTINRARQYGKTTVLQALKNSLSVDYIVARISFEGIGGMIFSEESRFCMGFDELFGKSLRFSSADSGDILQWSGYVKRVEDFLRLSEKITDFCAGRRVVLMIDEADQASDNQVFLHFLGMLREKYLARKAGEDYTFCSVILAGVYDVKNMKLRMAETGYAAVRKEEMKYNSPWNIAADFDIDMSLTVPEIGTMLAEYEADHHTGMNILETASGIWDYTRGYPFLVSRICQEMDENGLSWNSAGIQTAVKKILLEKNTLFDDIAHHLENKAELRSFLYELLILGQEKSFERSNATIDLAVTFGYIRNEEGYAVIDNRIFEIKISNYFISRNLESQEQIKITGVLAEDVIQDGHFSMEYALRKFAQHYEGLYENVKDRKFLEEHGRILFLTYLRPLINGKGFYHIESRTNSQRRMDLVVDYGADQYIVELKRWYGVKKQEDAYEQLYDYLESMHASEGYLLTFDFRQQKKEKMVWIRYKGKRIFEVVV